MHDNQITFTSSAQVALAEASDLIREARDWQLNVHKHTPAYHDEREELRERRQQVDEMERSLHVGLIHLMTTSQKHDGPLSVTRDMEACFFWAHQTSRYHGGLIFHRNHKIDGAIIGTWSIHT